LAGSIVSLLRKTVPGQLLRLIIASFFGRKKCYVSHGVGGGSRNDNKCHTEGGGV
jgi:hypothetical protein